MFVNNINLFFDCKAINIKTTNTSKIPIIKKEICSTNKMSIDSIIYVLKKIINVSIITNKEMFRGLDI